MHPKIKIFHEKISLLRVFNHRTSINQDYACTSIFVIPSSSRKDIVRVPTDPATVHDVTCSMSSCTCTIVTYISLYFSDSEWSNVCFSFLRVLSAYCPVFVPLLAVFLFSVVWERNPVKFLQ